MTPHLSSEGPPYGQSLILKASSYSFLKSGITSPLKLYICQYLHNLKNYGKKSSCQEVPIQCLAFLCPVHALRKLCNPLLSGLLQSLNSINTFPLKKRWEVRMVLPKDCFVPNLLRVVSAKFPLQLNTVNKQHRYSDVY